MQIEPIVELRKRITAVDHRLTAIGQTNSLECSELGRCEDRLAETDPLSLSVLFRIGERSSIARGDLKLRMQIPLEFGRDGKLVNAIEVEAAENTFIEGELLEVDANGSKLVFGREDTDEGQPIQQSFTITAETIITLDGQPAKLADLKQRSSLVLRLYDDGFTVRAIKAISSEADDDDKSENDDKLRSRFHLKRLARDRFASPFPLRVAKELPLECVSIHRRLFTEFIDDSRQCFLAFASTGLLARTGDGLSCVERIIRGRRP